MVPSVTSAQEKHGSKTLHQTGISKSLSRWRSGVQMRQVMTECQETGDLQHRLAIRALDVSHNVILSSSSTSIDQREINRIAATTAPVKRDAVLSEGSHNQASNHHANSSSRYS